MTPLVFDPFLFVRQNVWKAGHRPFLEAFSNISRLHSVADNGYTALRAFGPLEFARGGINGGLHVFGGEPVVPSCSCPMPNGCHMRLEGGIECAACAVDGQKDKHGVLPPAAGDMTSQPQCDI